MVGSDKNAGIGRRSASEVREASGSHIRIEYAGQHKRGPIPGQQLVRESDASKCPADLPIADAGSLLRAAITESIERGRSWMRVGDRSPRIVWGAVTYGNPPRRVAFEARESNPGHFCYHAYPIQQDRHSDKLPDSIYEWLWPAR